MSIEGNHVIQTIKTMSQKGYPFSKELCAFMVEHPDFFHSLKLSNEERFRFIPLIFTSHTPNGHRKCRDEVIGMWYLDTSSKKCRFHKRVCLFKQDFIVNSKKQNKEFISYSTNNCQGQYVRPIEEFFNEYGTNGKFYHDGNEWQHHYENVNNLPNEPRLKAFASQYILRYFESK